MPETSGQFSIANSTPSRERLAIQMKVGSNAFQASGSPQDVWSAVVLFRSLTEPPAQSVGSSLYGNWNPSPSPF